MMDLVGVAVAQLLPHQYRGIYGHPPTTNHLPATHR